MSTENGRFVLVRSDHVRVVIERPHVPYVLGRGRHLPAFQQLQSAYVSREHVTVTWDPPAVFLTQKGKNPTFIGADCRMIPAVGSPALEVRAAAGLDAPTVTTAADGHTTVTVPLCDPVTVALAPALTQRDAAVLFFPAEAGLPCIAIRCERTVGTTAAEARDGASAATSSLTTAQMLSVKAATKRLAGGDDEDDEDSEDNDGNVGRRGGGADSGLDALQGHLSASQCTAEERMAVSPPKQQWEGLLDAAMQQGHKEGKPTEVQSQARTIAVTPPTQTPATTPTAIPIPATVPRLATPSTTTTPQQLSGIGMWEWKCHANGPDSDPKSWRRYPFAVAQLLEAAYRAGKTVVDIPDTLLGITSRGGGRKRGRLNKDDAEDEGGVRSSGSAEPATYAVCLAEVSLDDGMIQFQKNDHAKFRVVRRTGGAEVDRKGLKGVSIIPTSSSSSSYADEDDSDSESDFSESESESVSSSDSDDKKRKLRKRRERK